MTEFQYKSVDEQEANYINDLMAMPFSKLDNIVMGMLGSAYPKSDPRYLLAMEVFNQRYSDQKPD